MFTTFIGTSTSPHAAQIHDKPGTRAFQRRSKRRQVTRACDWCRVHRIKCDSTYPCRNCWDRGGQCSNQSASEIRTLPHAVREIERLRARIQELEEQVGQCHSTHVAKIRPPAVGHASAASQPSSLNSFAEHRGHWKYWKGIHMRTAHSHQMQWYGPASAFYFIGRMSSYLANMLQQPGSEQQMHLISASTAYPKPMSPKGSEGGQGSPHTDATLVEQPLSPIQEDYFLNLYWQSYHCTYEILDEAEFKEHYRSLWTMNPTIRRPSALVDIVLALCMQFGTAFSPRTDIGSSYRDRLLDNDASISGRWLYRRCQQLLVNEMESPSIPTLQCHMLSVIYLCNASFQNMAHSVLATAIRSAHALGLHLDPSEDLPQPQREFRNLGRPFGTRMSQVCCALPIDDRDLVTFSGPISTSSVIWKDMTYHSYNIQSTKLILAARAIYCAFYDRCGEILGLNELESLYTKPEALAACAEYLRSIMTGLDDWLQNVPDTLKMSRKCGGVPFATDETTLNVGIFEPLWLQRQRILLELLYHNLCMNFFRPFISFGTLQNDLNRNANADAVPCIKHAMTITRIMSQILAETEVLNGWHEAFQWQWNAVITMIGFVLAYPTDQQSYKVRIMVDRAINVFETFGRNVAVARSAAAVTRDLAAKADILIHRSQENKALSKAFQADSTKDKPQDIDNSETPTVAASGLSGLTNGTLGDMQETFGDPLSWAFTVDSFNSFDPVTDFDCDIFDSWTFRQD